MGVKVDQVLPRDEPVDPDEVAPLVADALRQTRHLARDLRRVGAAGDDHQLMARIQLERGGEEQGQPLLPGDSAVEQGERPVCLDAEAGQRLGRRLRFVDVRVDPVVDDMQTVGVNPRIAAQHVLAHALRDRDHRVRAFDRCLLAERRQGVAAAQLLGLPWPERLEAVDGHHMGDRPHELRQVTSEVCVPRVAVHDVDALHSCRHREIDRHGLQRGCLGLRFRQGVPRLMVRDSRLVAGGAPAVDRDLGQPAKLSREVLDVSARTAVDLGRVLTGEDGDPGYGATWTFKPLPERNASMAFEYSSRPNRLVIMASQSITPLTSSLRARSKLCTTAMEPMILISSL